MKRVVVIGAGPMGRLHARAVVRRSIRTGDCVLEGVFDRHPSRSARVAEEFGARALEPGPFACDAAIVAVPAAEHAALCLGLLEDGLDVLVEKPMTGTAGGASALQAVAEKRKQILAVGHVEWWNPVWVRVLAAVSRPRHLHVRRTHPPVKRGLDVDVVQDLMLHDLDRVRRSVAAEITSIEASGRCVTNDRLDEARVALAFADGTTALLEASRVHTDRSRIVEVEGPEGSVRGDLLTGRVERDGVSIPPDATAEGDAEPLDLQLADFLEACRTRKPPANDAREAVATLVLVDRVRARIGAGT